MSYKLKEMVEVADGVHAYAVGSQYFKRNKLDSDYDFIAPYSIETVKALEAMGWRGMHDNYSWDSNTVCVYAKKQSEKIMQISLKIDMKKETAMYELITEEFLDKYYGLTPKGRKLVWECLRSLAVYLGRLND